MLEISIWAIIGAFVVIVACAILAGLVTFQMRLDRERGRAESAGLDIEPLIASAISPRIPHQHIWPSEPAIIDDDMAVYVCTCGKRLVRRKRKGLLL